MPCVSLFDFVVSVVVFGPLILAGLSVILLWRFRHRRGRVAVALVLLAMIAGGVFEEWSFDLGYPRPYHGPDTALRHVTYALSGILFGLFAAYAGVIGLLVYGGDPTARAGQPTDAVPDPASDRAPRGIFGKIVAGAVVLAVIAIALFA